MPLPASNPLLKAYQATLALLVAGSDNYLGAMIKPGNRVDYSENDDTTKAMIVDADVPELQLVDEGGTFNVSANSSGCSYLMNMSIIVSTGDYRLPIASAINWYIMVNFGKWGEVLAGTTWKGLPFIKNVQPIPIQIGESNPERNRNIKGWTTIWRMQLELRFPHTNLTFIE